MTIDVDMDLYSIMSVGCHQGIFESNLQYPVFFGIEVSSLARWKVVHITKTMKGDNDGSHA